MIFSHDRGSPAEMGVVFFAFEEFSPSFKDTIHNLFYI